MPLPDIAQDPSVAALIRRALEEDIGSGDVTTAALVPESASVQTCIFARGDYVISGNGVAEAVFRALDASVAYEVLAPDGRQARDGDGVAFVRGPARAILTAERTALNFLQRMTGIATLTHRFVQAVRDYGTTILDTRKTTPGLRLLEKYAVTCGGGRNHRMGLYDRVMIKDNHRRLWKQMRSGGLREAVQTARRRYPGMEVEVEVESESDFLCALEAGPDWILLDNTPADDLRHFVQLAGGRCRLEASGGVTLANVASIAATGVDAVSLGALTHSAPAADLSLELV